MLAEAGATLEVRLRHQRKVLILTRHELHVTMATNVFHGLPKDRDVYELEKVLGGSRQSRVKIDVGL